VVGLAYFDSIRNSSRAMTSKYRILIFDALTGAGVVLLVSFLMGDPNQATQAGGGMADEVRSSVSERSVTSGSRNLPGFNGVESGQEEASKPLYLADIETEQRLKKRAKKDPRGALAELEQMGPNWPQYRLMKIELLVYLAGKEPEYALKQYADLIDPDSRNDRLWVYTAYNRLGAGKQKSVLESLPDLKKFDSIRKALIGSWTASNPAEAYAWITKDTGTATPEDAESYVKGLVQSQSLDQMEKMIDGFEDVELKRKGVTALINKEMMTGHWKGACALTLLHSSDSLRESALLSIVSTAPRGELSGIVEWIQKNTQLAPQSVVFARAEFLRKPK
jgi:hypothetical protein